MGPKTIIAMGAQTITNFLTIRTERWSSIHRLPADVWTRAMHCNIGKNHKNFFWHVDSKCFTKLKRVKYAGYVWQWPIALSVATT